MKLQEQIDSLREEIRMRGKLIQWLRKHQAVLEKLPDIRLSSYREGLVDFDNLSHADVIKVVRGIGGKWAKTASAAGTGLVDYETEFDGKRLRCWGGQAPPSCRLVEIEEDVPEQVIPAHKRKVMKLICTDHPEPVAVALAQANTKPTAAEPKEST